MSVTIVYLALKANAAYEKPVAISWILIIQFLEEVQGELSEEIKSVRTQMAQIGAKIEYKNSFMEMIDRTKQKAYNRVPFHYLNPAIRFHGREEEMAALDAFREDDRQVLFSVFELLTNLLIS